MYNVGMLLSIGEQPVSSVRYVRSRSKTHRFCYQYHSNHVLGRGWHCFEAIAGCVRYPNANTAIYHLVALLDGIWRCSSGGRIYQGTFALLETSGRVLPPIPEQNSMGE